MRTLVDFVTHNKGIEYLLAIAFIAGYALFAEFLKPKPFSGLVSSVRDDAEYMKGEGKRDVKRLMKNLVLTPLVAGAYLAALPVYMMVGLILRAEGALASTIGGGSMAWRPLESYLTGRARKGSGKKVEAESKEAGE